VPFAPSDPQDRIKELSSERLKALDDQTTVRFVSRKLEEELSRLHNPDSTKTIGLFRDFAGIDLESGWNWNNFNLSAVKLRLDGYLKLRGDVVHRSRVSCSESSHPVTKDELEKAISFLKHLVDATERAIKDQRAS
jgi:hypothetical protein